MAVSTMDTSIIVKNLPAGVYVPELCDAFSCFGNIVSATVHTYENKSEACIDFERGFSALQAVKRMDNFKLRSKMIKVIMSSENERFQKVYVKNINPYWDECDLMQAFEGIGVIEDAVISRDDEGKSLGYGFIVFKDHSAAQKAVNLKNNAWINGRTLVVERFKSKSERESLKLNSVEHVEGMLLNSIQLNNLHVKNLPSGVREDEFKQLFSKYGMISSAKIMTNEKGASRGFGFVCYATDEEAALALSRMNGYLWKGHKLEVNFKEDGHLRKQFTFLKNKDREVNIKQYKQRSRSVQNLLPRPLLYKF